VGQADVAGHAIKAAFSARLQRIGKCRLAHGEGERGGYRAQYYINSKTGRC